MPYYVYILLCKDGSYYTGYAKDMKSRLEQHRKLMYPSAFPEQVSERFFSVEPIDLRSIIPFGILAILMILLLILLNFSTNLQDQANLTISLILWSFQRTQLEK